MPDIQISSTDTSGARGAANPISLAHVLALSVPVHWTESVAVIEELCLALTAAGEPVLVPDPQDVLITAQGSLMIRRGAPGVDDVEGIGRMLNALLDPVTTPIPLRLFVAHSIGSEKYRSVAAYGEALAYYARPDRTELIQALYRRCLESATVVLPVVEEPVRVEVPPPVPAAPLVERRKLPRWVPVAAALVIVVVGSYFVFRKAISASGATPVRTLTAAASSVVQSVRRLITPAPAPPSETASAPVERGTPASTPARVRRPALANATSATGGNTVDAPALTVDQVATPGEPQILLPLDSETVSEGALALPPVAAASAERGLFSDPTAYTSASPDVQPPVLYAPKLPPLPPVTPDILGTNTMELLVDEAGAVQLVQLKTRPVRLSDMLLLSAAKTWKFYPAMKDGHPVKYKLAVSWVVAPP